MDTREDILQRMLAHPVTAHEVVFKHRRQEVSPEFHKTVITDWYSKKPFVLNLMFRGAAKSTLAEEAVVLMASFGMFNNALIIGETETRAKERLTAIKREFENNDDLRSLFGEQCGTPWQETVIVLRNGVRVQALGRGQSLRGAKHLHYRPDMAFCDDLEDEETTANEEGRRKTREWFLKTLLPALTPNARIRMCATPLHPDALAVRLSNSNKWVTRSIPICSVDKDTGEEVAAWPERYPMRWVMDKREEYDQMGAMSTWLQEFMCVAISEENQLFKPEMVRVEPLARTWQPVMAAYDPARTVKQTSDFTGKVVGSWVGNRLVLWEARALRCRPSELVDDVVRTCEQYQPSLVVIEEDGLNEFVMQPLRVAASRTSQFMPVRPVKAPKDKRSFIKSLHPFFAAGDIVFANDRASFADLEAQMMSFPVGKIDTLNALAYLLKMRPGQPVFPEFSHAMVTASDNPASRPVAKRWWLSFEADASPAMTAAVLMVLDKGVLHIVADWLRENGPGVAFPEIMQEARAMAQMPLNVVVPSRLMAGHDTTGLVAAARAFPVMPSQGGERGAGLEAVRSMMLTLRDGRPRLRVSDDAGWTLKALAGALFDNCPPRDWPTLLTNAVFGFAGLAGVVRTPGYEEVDNETKYAYDRQGHRFMTARQF